MRVMVCVIDDATGTATEAEMAAITAFNSRLREEGRLEFACGVAGPSQSLLIDNRDGLGEVTAGSLEAGPDFVSGFWILTVPDAATARELAHEASRCCHRRVELRPLLG